MVARTSKHKSGSDDRADTPMNGNGRGEIPSSPTHSASSQENLMARKDANTASPSGFTAVNGDTIVVANPGRHTATADVKVTTIGKPSDSSPVSSQTPSRRSGNTATTSNGHPSGSTKRRRDAHQSPVDTAATVGADDDHEVVVAQNPHKRIALDPKIPRDAVKTHATDTTSPVNGASNKDSIINESRKDRSGHLRDGTIDRTSNRPRLVTDDASDQHSRHAQRTAHPESLAHVVSAEVSKLASPALHSASEVSSALTDRHGSHHIERRIGPYSREPSPVPRSQAAPRPTARPETEADLAASLHRELHGTSESPASPTLAEDQSVRSIRESYSPGDRSPQSPDRVTQLNHELKKRKRTFSNRTKTGCHTCRQRKKKCDERKPTCHNCERGGFSCTGYGPKPPSIKPIGTAQRMIALQSKPYVEPHPQYPPHPYYPPRPDDGRHYPGWSRPGPPEHEAARPIDHRSNQYPDHWNSRSYWPGHESQAGSHSSSGPLPPPPPSHRLSEHEHQRQYPVDIPRPHMYSQLPDQPRAHNPLPPPPPPPLTHDSEHWGGSSGLPSVMSSGYQIVSSRDSAAGSGSSSRTLQTQDQYIAKRTRKDMILGQPFCYYTNQTLMADRQNCRGALERYNDAAKPSSYVSAEERGRFFRAVVDPSVRPGHNPTDVADMPCGAVGSETVVEAPFTCDFGYNIHLGNDVIIQPGCYMQDPCEIRIGSRTVIGPNVRFYGLTTSVDPVNRNGIRQRFYGGAIIIEEDCMIGGDVIIMPFRKIGKGAVVGAGSVVTKDVAPYTIVAGNPARYIRGCPPQRTSERHEGDRIQQQNDRMLREMQTNYEAALERSR